MVKKSWDKRSNAKKVTKTRLRPPLTVFLKLWHKIFKLVYLQQQPKTRSKQKLFCDIRALMDLTALLVFGHICKGYVYTPKFKRNIDTFGSETAQYTRQMPLRLTFRQMQKK